MTSKRRGRPPTLAPEEQSKIQSFRLANYQIDWLQEQPGWKNATVRRLIDREINRSVAQSEQQRHEGQ